MPLAVRPGGLERPELSPLELLSLRVPCLTTIDQPLLRAVIDAEHAAAAMPVDATRLATLDEVVFDLYELDPEQRLIVRETTDRARHFIIESHRERGALVRPPTNDTLHAFASQVVQSINAYLRARAQRHLEAHIYTQAAKRSNLARGLPGVTAIRFVMASGKPVPFPTIHHGNPVDLTSLISLLQGTLDANIAPYLNERRQLHLYGASDLYVVKPSETRYWTRTAALNDADRILSDHWPQGPHDTTEI